ncbi:hypothetical protein GSI_09506 [Ganoderma sinense ZZ0214-1]|uniref:Glucose-methanol-choline oxidoreductase N-terminal domain-containing protein n=1 Tax=Ganoderma sinense ZZ0214-1 TaxID=1077348 RepID=A0A2G8S3P1_9APHY|nr:hypothetical protein GSI_09506 [Ganoderma sinense ZZ0214-1]
MASPQLFDEYDIIITGVVFERGTAGGVILARLAAAAPSLRILMLEAGPSTRDDKLPMFSQHAA